MTKFLMWFIFWILLFWFIDHRENVRPIREQLVIHAADFNDVFTECQQKNEAAGRVYGVSYTFVDGTPFDPKQVITNVRQCGGLKAPEEFSKEDCRDYYGRKRYAAGEIVNQSYEFRVAAQCAAVSLAD